MPDPDDLLARLGLTDVADQNPRDLSGGQQQRLAIAATLASGARLLLLDEPTRGMDGIQKVALGETLRALQDDGLAVVIATHDVELVARLATRVLLLGGGQVVAEGPPRAILAGALTYGTQVNKLFGGSYLTVADILQPTTR
jgi:energy-coupling factor transport system ATP-binding protein